MNGTVQTEDAPVVSILESTIEPTEGELAEVDVIETAELENDALFFITCKQCNRKINLLTCRYPNGNVECAKCKAIN